MLDGKTKILDRLRKRKIPLSDIVVWTDYRFYSPKLCCFFPEALAIKSKTNAYMGYLLHFVAFFHVASLFSTGVDNEKGGVDNEKALELTNSTVFHRGRQWKSSRAGQQNTFFIFQPDFNVEYNPKMPQNILLHSGMITPNILVETKFFVA
jgi:hypothetical protein